MATEASLAGGQRELAFDERPPEEKTLYLCFNDDESGRALRDRFNTGLARLDVEVVVERYFADQC